MSRSADFLLDLIFPNTCPFCGCFIRWNEYCCAECAGSLERADFCIRCGSAKCCCETSERDFAACAAARPYVGKVRRGILELKYHNGFNAAKSFKGAPSVLICRSIKGKGVSFMENQVNWHGSAPKVEQYEKAMSELDELYKTIEEA